ncbi:MAG: His/Gly/Thr/Pro-type tRNA ligase C-terminal domain-containing protein, partial [Gemmatimonadota bacterium]
VHLDDRETMNPGAKFYEWERKGVPLRIEVGPRDIARQQVVVVRRFAPEGTERKRTVGESEAFAVIPRFLDDFQRDMLRAARERREANSVRGMEDYDAFRDRMEGQGGFVYAGWCGSPACEDRVKEETKATIRVLPDPDFRSDEAPASCLACGDDASSEALWARAY